MTYAMRTMYLINPRPDIPTYFSAEVYGARGFRPATLMADLSLPTVAALASRHLDVVLCDESIEAVNFDVDADYIGITGKVSQRGHCIGRSRRCPLFPLLSSYPFLVNYDKRDNSGQQRSSGWRETVRAIPSILALVLSCAPLMMAGAQTDTTRTDLSPWRAWAFARLGGASTAPVSVATSGGGVQVSLGAGIAESRGKMFGMARVTDNEQFFVGPGERDEALLAGMRSAGDRAFVSGAVGIAHATAHQTYEGGTTTSAPEAAFAYDFSAHTAYRFAGLALSISGVAGPHRTSYVAVTLGAEVGWFGR